MSINILKLKANMKSAGFMMEDDGFFKTDGSSKFIFDDSETTRKTFIVDGDMYQLIPVSGSMQPSPYLSDSMTWEVTVTNKRIIFWSSKFTGMMGGVKESPGASTGGYFGYKDITDFHILDAGDNASYVTVCFIGKIGDNRVTTLIPFLRSELLAFVECLFDQMKAFWSDDPIQKGNLTLDNYKNAIIAEFPKILIRTMSITGSFIIVNILSDQNDEDSDEILDRAVTDIRAYKEKGVTLKLDDGSEATPLDPPVSVPTQIESTPQVDTPQVNKTPAFCSGCGHNLNPNSKFCGKCGKPVAGKA